MRFFPKTFKGLACLCLILFSFFSCSKDSDLLAEYVDSAKPDAILLRFLKDDNFLARSNARTRLDVLANDNIPEGSEVTITETSAPENGTVSINEDNSITYTGSDVEEGSDSFTYTVEVQEEDNTVSEETATVTVTVSNAKSIDMGELKAFPGAEGFGRFASGGRGGKIVEVTNLNDSGPGSLRAALMLNYKRTIVFKVSGTIVCNSYLKIPDDGGDVTIAGQTAPGEGIQIKGAEFRIQDSNVIMRHIRIRPGSSVPYDGIGEANDALRILAFRNNHTQNVIIDHCSLYWGKDENVEVGGIGGTSHVSNVTVQNCIIAENIGWGHQFAFLLWERARNISVFKNLFAHHTERSITSTTPESNYEMVNNIVYSFAAATQFTYQNVVDVIGNVYVSNPAVPTRNETVRLQIGTGDLSMTKAYLNDNLLDGGNITYSKNGVNDLRDHIVSNRNFHSGLTPIPSSTLLPIVLNDAGASLSRDAADTRIVNNVKNRNGKMINNESEVGGYPVIKEEKGYTDNDHDGMSDEWEVQNGFDPSNPDDGNMDADGDGYTNLEVFLHYLTQ